MRRLAVRLGGRWGGTEIGAALEAVLAKTMMRDVLLITDGKSHALGAAAIALRAAGCRVSVLLVGEDSLEAQVGHLAALTSGEIAVAAAQDVQGVLDATLRALTSVPTPSADSAFVVVRGHAAIAVAAAANVGGADPLLTRAVGAVVAGLRLATLPQRKPRHWRRRRGW